MYVKVVLVKRRIKFMVITLCLVKGVFPLTIFLQYFLLIPPENIRNLWFSDVFRGIKKEHREEKG